MQAVVFYSALSFFEPVSIHGQYGIWGENCPLHK